MFLEEKSYSILAILFFIVCSIETIHLFFSVSNVNVKRKIYSVPLMYGTLISVLETTLYEDIPNFHILPSRFIGGMLGCITGFYVGYQFFYLIKMIDETSFIESQESKNKTAIVTGLCVGFAEVGRLLGSYLGYFLFPM